MQEARTGLKSASISGRACNSVILDVERFLTQVLGKLSNLPDEVNRERLELSQRLQKFLNLPDGEAKKKQPLPPPVEPEEATSAEVIVLTNC